MPGERRRGLGLAAFALGIGLVPHRGAAETPAQGMFGEMDRIYESYERFKDRLHTDHGIRFSMAVSSYLQWGGPRGGPGVAQLVYRPAVTWTPFTDTAFGSGSFTFQASHNHFWTGANTGSQAGRLRALSPPSDWTGNGYEFGTIAYTHTMPGALNWLSVTVGQFAVNTYDGNQYAGDSPSGFINYALAQNATQTYGQGGVGSYIHAVSQDGQYLFAGGFQGATDVQGRQVTTRGLSNGQTAYFAAAQWSPTWLPGATYGVLWYSQPSVPMQPGASQGVSFNAVQDFGTRWGLFLRANTASGAVAPIRTSVAWGGIVNDPFGRHEKDQVGLGFFWNKANRSVEQDLAHDGEWGAELYYNYTLFRGLQVTPDIQFYFNPALQPRGGPAAVFSIHTTAFF